MFLSFFITIFFFYKILKSSEEFNWSFKFQRECSSVALEIIKSFIAANYLYEYMIEYLPVV